ncbi:MAG: metallophosphoesterase [Candidatus Cloacimonetes bacterium]|nr:metallophosphoesterase [Candidatus Cloacimonadota bacterium]
MLELKTDFGKILLLVVIFAMQIMQLSCQEFQTENENFYFVQITDTHIGKGTNLEITKSLIRQINKLPMEIKFVIHTGDIVNDGLIDTNTALNALSAFIELEVPIYFIPGNHDIYEAQFEQQKKIYNKYFGDLVFVNEFAEIVFIGIYSDPLAYGFKADGYEPFVELKLALKETKEKPVILFHHIPTVGFFYNNEMHPGWNSENRNKWQDLLNSYNLVAVIAGHFHGSEQHWLGEIPIFVAASATNRFGRQPSFRIYEFKNGKLNFRTQYEE